MKWQDLVASWDDDADLQRVYAQEYPYHAVADAIVELRGRMGLTQTELAERAGTTQSVIARLESGKHAVRVDLLNRIADAVGLPWKPVFGVEIKRAPAANVTVVGATFSAWITTDRLWTHGASTVVATAVTNWPTLSVASGPILPVDNLNRMFGGSQREPASKPEPFPLLTNRQSTLALAG